MRLPEVWETLRLPGVDGYCYGATIHRALIEALFHRFPLLETKNAGGQVMLGYLNDQNVELPAVSTRASAKLGDDGLIAPVYVCRLKDGKIVPNLSGIPRQGYGSTK